MVHNFKKGANDNTLYVTSICSNRCIMCCQPPIEKDDSDILWASNIKLINSGDVDTDYVCITGGEPTLIGKKLFDYINEVWNRMPNADIHLLTNGRLFANKQFIGQFFTNVRGNIIFGIPLHSDNPLDHDKIAGAKNAFHETLKGLHNLGLLQQQVELRIILLKQNYRRLERMAEFITRNLPFVSQVSIMGLEIVGCAERHYKDIYIDSMECTEQMEAAILYLQRCKIQAKIYNMPLCLLPQSLWKYACRSISTWKKTNLESCKECILIEQCCGVFSTSKRYSPHIKPTMKELVKER